MKALLLLRRAHLWLGCLFAPLLIYYCLSGCWQTLGWNSKGSGKAWQTDLSSLSSPHLSQTWPGGSAKKGQSSAAFRYSAVAMTLGMTLTALLGLQMAFKSIRPWWKVFLVLAAGVLLPVGMLWLAAR